MNERIDQRERNAFIKYITALTEPLFTAQQELTRARMGILAAQSSHVQPQPPSERPRRRLRQSFLTNGFLAKRRRPLRRILPNPPASEGDTHMQLHLSDCLTWEAEESGEADENEVMQIPPISAKRSRILCSQLKRWKTKRKRPPLRRVQQSKPARSQASKHIDSVCTPYKGKPLLRDCPAMQATADLGTRYGMYTEAVQEALEFAADISVTQSKGYIGTAQQAVCEASGAENMVSYFWSSSQDEDDSAESSSHINSPSPQSQASQQSIGGVT